MSETMVFGAAAVQQHSRHRLERFLSSIPRTKLLAGAVHRLVWNFSAETYYHPPYAEGGRLGCLVRWAHRPE
jgi:hypothetical protein